MSSIEGSKAPGSNASGSNMEGSKGPGSNSGSNMGGSKGPGSNSGSNMGGSKGPGSNSGSNPGSNAEPSCKAPGSNTGSNMGGSQAQGSNAPGSNAAGSRASGQPNSEKSKSAAEPMGSNDSAEATGSNEPEPKTAPPPPPPPPPPPQESPSSASMNAEESPVDGSRQRQRQRRGGRVQRRRKGEVVDLNNCRIGLLGAGKMSESLFTAMTAFAKIDPGRIYVSSKSGRNHDCFARKGANVTKRSYDLFAKFDCDLVFFCFHGFVIRQLYKTGGTRPMALTVNYIPNMRHPLFLLSLVGGVSLNDIKYTLLNPDNPDKYQLEMHRLVLNTSIAFGVGLGALDIEPDSRKCHPLVRDLLGSFARLEFVPEANMDQTCAVAGSGLAFCYYFLSALADGGFKMGLPKTLALKLTAKTLISASASLLESGKHPSDLRDQCTSPSGPAIYGLHVLDKADCASGIAAAVEAAFKRIKELVDNSTPGAHPPI